MYHNVTRSLHVCVVPKSVCFPLYATCATHDDIFQSRERDQSWFVTVLCDSSL